MKTVQPKGPYFLFGGSIGGLIAFDIAQQLSRQGEQTALLFLLDQISPVKFSSEEIAEIILLNSRKKLRYSLENKYYKLKVAISKIAGAGFNLILNSGLSLPYNLREK